MPKVIKSGIFSKELGFPEKVPAEMEACCHRCFAELKTQKDEPGAKMAHKRDSKSGLLLAGWKIPCPECSAKVFFVLDPAIYIKVILRINQS